MEFFLSHSVRVCKKILRFLLAIKVLIRKPFFSRGTDKKPCLKQSDIEDAKESIFIGPQRCLAGGPLFREGAVGPPRRWTRRSTHPPSLVSPPGRRTAPPLADVPLTSTAGRGRCRSPRCIALSIYQASNFWFKSIHREAKRQKYPSLL